MYIPVTFPTTDFQYVENFLGGHYKIEQQIANFEYQGVDRDTNERVTIFLIYDLFQSKYDIWRVLEEMQRNSVFQHDNIAFLSNVKVSSKFEDFKTIMFVMERFDTDLQEIIYSKQKLTIDQRRFIVYQILRGLKYLQTGNVAHKYLRPDKILVNANCDIKIDSLNYDYHFPESLMHCHEYESFASDIWSVGCILYELITGKPLFKGRNGLDQVLKIVNTIGSPNYDDDLYYVKSQQAIEFMNSIEKVDEADFEKVVENGSEEEIDLIRMMIKWNPSKRITVEEALKHPYFEILHDVSDEPCCSPINSPTHEWMDIVKIKKLFWKEIQDIRKNKNFK